jgi:uncharacterized membrane protein YccC
MRGAAWKRLKETGWDIIDELRHFSLKSERAVLCVQTAASVLWAIGFASVLHLPERWWVALSAFAVYRASLRTVIRRCLERLAGTVIGGGTGLLLATMLAPHSALLVILFGAVACVGIYAMIGSYYSYSWILGTVTALMVLEDTNGGVSLEALAFSRIVDVAVGVSTTALVATLAAVAKFDGNATPPAQNVPHALPQPFSSASTRRQRLVHALQGAACIALMAWIDLHHPWPGLPQAIISVVAVLLVPAAAFSDGSAMRAVHGRLLNRLLGCLLATLCALWMLPLVGHSNVICWMMLAAGTGLATYVQAGAQRVSYLGTQFGVGVILVFVPDGGSPPSVDGAIERLLGILFALALMGLLAVFVSLAPPLGKLDT